MPKLEDYWKNNKKAVKLTQWYCGVRVKPEGYNEVPL